MKIQYPVIACCEGDLQVFASEQELRSGVEAPDVEDGLWEFFDSQGVPMFLKPDQPSEVFRWGPVRIVDPVFRGEISSGESSCPEELRLRLVEYFQRCPALIEASSGEVEAMTLDELVTAAVGR